MQTDQLVVAGVDTHKDSHVVVALDHLGRLLGASSFATTAARGTALIAWLRRQGTLGRVGVEGCGSYGAGLGISPSGGRLVMKLAGTAVPTRWVRRG